MDCETIIFEVADSVATITLDRPEVMNSFNNEMASEMTWAWETIRETDDIHAVVLQASGDRAFTTGVDVETQEPWFRKTNIWNTFDPGVTLSPRSNQVWKPVICAVHGICAGSGFFFINEADIIICSDEAEFFDPHANAGLVSSVETIGLLVRNIPLGEVMRWALMGSEERISASTALRIGLVSEVVPTASLRERAREIALSIAKRNPVAIQGTVRAVWESLDMPRLMALQNASAYTKLGNLRPEERGAYRKRGPHTYR